MTNYDNNDLYQITLNRLRKDRKGSVTPEEWESFLRNRNIDYFNQQMKFDGGSLLNIDSLSPFMEARRPLNIQTASGVDYVDLITLGSGTTTTTDGYAYLEEAYAHLVNAWFSASATDLTSLTEIDLVSSTELHDRLNNANTGPSTDDPIGSLEGLRLSLWGVNDAGYAILDYYRYPADPYFDYYTDAVGNITYLTEGQASYTLQAGEVARDGSTAGQSVTSASIDLEWTDQDALNIVDMLMTDTSLAQSDQPQNQGSIFEREQNVKS